VKGGTPARDVGLSLLNHREAEEPPLILGLGFGAREQPHDGSALHNLTIVSVGTGSFRYRTTWDQLPWAKALGVAVHALRAQISDSQQFILTLMSLFGESPTPWIINSELGDLGATPAPGGQPLFRFMRYDVRLEPDWLKSELGVSIDAGDLKQMRRLDASENLTLLHELGARAAQRQVRVEHLAATAR
jgi:hypothetical protein